MQTIRFKYKIGDIVFIKGLEMSGKIDAVMFCDVAEFRVIFWFNGERKAIWLQDWEIELKS